MSVRPPSGQVQPPPSGNSWDARTGPQHGGARRVGAGPCPSCPGRKRVELTFIEVAEKRTLIVARVGFDATSPRMCLAPQ